MKKRKPRVGELSAFDLIEDAIHLARDTAWQSWLVYYLGTIPFVIGFLFFWSDMSESAFAQDHLFGGSFLLAVGFVFLKCCQSATMSAMRAQLAGTDPEPWTPQRASRAFVTQATLSPWGLLIRPIALLITLPYAWIAAAYQNMVILGDGTRSTADVWKESIRLAKLWPRQNHEALVILWLFMMVIWLNIVSILTIAPSLLKLLFGFELLLAPGSWSILNSTFLFVTCALTYLCTDPLFKAFYVVRSFRGAALSTGADIRADLERLRKPVSIAAILAVSLTLGSAVAQETDSEAGPREIAPAVLDEEITETLDNPRFAWRMPRPENEDKGVIESFFEDAWEAVTGALNPIGKWIGDFFDWIRKGLSPADDGTQTSLPDFTKWNGLLIIVAIVLALVALGIGIWFIWRRGRRKPIEAEAATLVAVPDLTSEDLLANELPQDEWLRIAREKAANGDYRLALRALFLAGLAGLGERNLVSLARHKSNLEYERELARKSRNDPELTHPFHENVTDFERVWYGDYSIDPDGLAAFEKNLNRLLSIG